MQKICENIKKYFKLYLIVTLIFLLIVITSLYPQIFGSFFRIYENFSWPWLILFIVLIFRKNFAKLFNKISKVKSSFFEIFMDHESTHVSQFLSEVAFIEKSDLEIIGQLEDQFNWNRAEFDSIEYYLNKNPSKAILIAYDVLSREYIKLGKEEFYLTHAHDKVNFSLVVEYFYCTDIINYETRESFKKFEIISSLINEGKVDRNEVTNHQAKLFKNLMIYGLMNLPPGPQSYLTIKESIITKYTYSQTDLLNDLTKIIEYWPDKQEDIKSVIEKITAAPDWINLLDLKNELENMKFVKVGKEYNIVMNLILTYLVHGRTPFN